MGSLIKVNASDWNAFNSLEEQSRLWMTDQVCFIVQWVILSISCFVISFLGTVGNGINIICFVKQGFQDSVNVNFLGLAVSDMGCLLTTILMSIGCNPIFQALEKPFNSVEVIYLVAGWPHFLLTRVTSLITTLITVERCLCIILPLKVKSIITPFRAGGAIAAIFLVEIFSVVPWYYANRLVLVFSAEKNKTLLELTFAADREIPEAIAVSFNHLIVPFSSFLIITACTSVLVVSLRRKSQWRERSRAVINEKDLSSREQKVIRMVLAISLMFIACYFPMAVIFTIMMFMPGLAIDGRNFNVTIIVGSIGLFLESVNSSLNIFIYYNMSTKYRAVLRQVFGLSP